jgi:hypothetical protein
LLQSVDVSGNALTLPISSLSGCTSLLFADLSSNALDCPSDGLLDSLLSQLPVSLQTLRLDHNPLRGCRWQSAVGSVRSSSPLLQALTASHTGITQLPEDLFEPSLPWRALDFSYCHLTVGVSDRYVPSSQLLSFSIKGNSALESFTMQGVAQPRSAIATHTRQIRAATGALPLFGPPPTCLSSIFWICACVSVSVLSVSVPCAFCSAG